MGKLFVICLFTLIILTACSGDNKSKVSQMPAAQPGQSQAATETTYTLSKEDLYARAVVNFNMGSFSEALIKLEEIPDDYMRTHFYKTAIVAYDAFEAGEWLEAVRMFDELSKELKINEYLDEQDALLTRELLESPDPKKFNEAEEMLRPLNKKITDLQTGRNAVFVEIMDVEVPFLWNEASIRFFNEMFYECLYFYYDELILAGQSLDNPAEYSPKAVMAARDRKCDIFQNHLNAWKNYRRDKLKAIIDKKPEDFDISNNSTASPVSGAGTAKLVINTKNAPQNSTYLAHLDYGISPFAYADSLENIRYIIDFTETYAFFGTYDDGTSGYTSIVKVEVKDIATDTILFSNEYTKNPPEATPRTGLDSYGKFSNLNTGNEMADNIAAVLLDLFPAL